MKLRAIEVAALEGLQVAVLLRPNKLIARVVLGYQDMGGHQILPEWYVEYEVQSQVLRETTQL